MNTAAYVDEQIAKLKGGGVEAAWKLALLCVGWPYIFGDRGEYCTPSKRQAVYNKTGTESLIKKCQVLNGSKASCNGCKWFPKGCKVRSFDCRGFTYWILLQIYGWKLQGAGATSQWNTESNWRAKGEVKDGIPQGVIVCLFYYKKDENGNRTKTLSHTGLYYNGETCECSNGVQHSKTLNPKWEVWAVPACVDGDVTPVPPPEPEPGENRPTLRRGSKGEYVTLLQTMLVNRGYDIGKTGVDGDFGKATEKAVIAFQKASGLQADGIVGKKTWAALDSEIEPITYTATITGLNAEQIASLQKEFPGKILVKEG
jgi:cell wall-associated NlpC family hydrolase